MTSSTKSAFLRVTHLCSVHQRLFACAAADVLDDPLTARPLAAVLDQYETACDSNSPECGR